MGLRPEIRAELPLDDFITQHLLGEGGRVVVVVFLGLERSQGSKFGPVLGVKTGIEAHRVGWVGKLDSGGCCHCYMEASKKEDRPGNVGVLPQPLHLTLSDLCYHLIYNQGGETAWGKKRSRGQERGRQRETAQSLQFCFLTGGDGSVNQLTEWLPVN